MLKSYIQFIKGIRANIFSYAIEAWLSKDDILNNLVYNKVKPISYNGTIVDIHVLKRIIDPIREENFCVKPSSVIVNLCLEEYIDVINSAIDMAINCEPGGVYFVKKIEIICNRNKTISSDIKYQAIDDNIKNYLLESEIQSSICTNQIVNLCTEDYLKVINSGISYARNCMPENRILVCKCAEQIMGTEVGNVIYIEGVIGKTGDSCIC